MPRDRDDFARAPGDEDPKRDRWPSWPRERFDLWTWLRHRRADAAEDRVLEDPLGHWHPIGGDWHDD